MNAPISIRLDQEVRDTLEAEARAQGIGLATYLRQLALEAAKTVRRNQIRKDSASVANHIAADAEAQEFMRDWSGGP